MEKFLVYAVGLNADNIPDSEWIQSYPEAIFRLNQKVSDAGFKIFSREAQFSEPVPIAPQVDYSEATAEMVRILTEEFPELEDKHENDVTLLANRILYSIKPHIIEAVIQARLKQAEEMYGKYSSLDVTSAQFKRYDDLFDTVSILRSLSGTGGDSKEPGAPGQH